MEHFELTPPPGKERPLTKRNVFVVKDKDIPPEARGPARPEKPNFHEQFKGLFEEDGHLKPDVSAQFFSEDQQEAARYRDSLPDGAAQAIVRHTFMAISGNRCDKCMKPHRPDKNE